MKIKVPLKCFGEFNSHLGPVEVPDSCWAVVFRQHTSGHRKYLDPGEHMSIGHFLSSSSAFPNVIATSPVHSAILEIDDCAHTQGDFIEATTEDALFILWSDQPFAIVLPEEQYTTRDKPELFISGRLEAGVFSDEPCSWNSLLGLINLEYHKCVKPSLLQFLASKAQPPMAMPVQP